VLNEQHFVQNEHKILGTYIKNNFF